MAGKGEGFTRRTALTAAAIGTLAAGSDPTLARSPARPAAAFRALTYRAEGPICVIALNLAETDNRLDRAALDELPVAWDAFRTDDTLKVAIFTASGDTAFCSGIDLGAVRGAVSDYPPRDEGQRSYTSKQNHCWKPVIAAVNGFVAGPGLHFVLDADICISVPEATYFDAHMHHSGSVPIIEPIEMARKIPASVVSRMFLLGPHDPLTAERAKESGLISEVVPRDRLMTRAFELARQIAECDMHLTTAFVEALYKARELGVTEAVNRGLIIRQLAGYRDAPLKDRSMRDLAVPRGPR